MKTRFEIRGEISRDDSSVVWRAFDRTMQREVILKRLTPEATQDERYTAHLTREARAVAQVRSEHVLGIFEVGEDEEGPFLCIEPARGECLAERIERLGTLEVEETVRIGLQLCDALSSIHRASLIHRNIRIEQVFLDENGEVRLSGFAMAKRVAEKSGYSTVIGQTTTFLRVKQDLEDPYAPEEMLGHDLTALSDIFGLGVVLTQCLTGVDRGPKVPVSELPAHEKTSKATHFPDPDKLRAKRPDIPKALEETLKIALATMPWDRQESASDFAANLRAALEPAETKSGTSSGSAKMGGLGWKSMVGVAAVLVLVALFVPGIRNTLFPGEPGEATTTANRATEGGTADERGLKRPRNPATALVEGYENTYALVVGINDYGSDDWQDLATATNDARAFRNYLVDEEGVPASNVRLLLDEHATGAAIRNDLRERLPHAKKNDRVIFYFAGHGQKSLSDDSIGYIVPSDGDAGRGTHIAHQTLKLVFDEVEAKHILFLLDCCYSGHTTRGAGSSAKLYAQATTKKAHQIMAAGAPGEPVADRAKDSPKHSPFTAHLIDGLRGAASAGDQDYIAFTDLFHYVRRKVRLETQGAQNPSAGFLSGGGDVVFIPKTLRKD